MLPEESSNQRLRQTINKHILWWTVLDLDPPFTKSNRQVASPQLWRRSPLKNLRHASVILQHSSGPHVMCLLPEPVPYPYDPSDHVREPNQLRFRRRLRVEILLPGPSTRGWKFFSPAQLLVDNSSTWIRLYSWTALHVIITQGTWHYSSTWSLYNPIMRKGISLWYHTSQHTRHEQHIGCMVIHSGSAMWNLLPHLLPSYICTYIVRSCWCSSRRVTYLRDVLIHMCANWNYVTLHDTTMEGDKEIFLVLYSLLLCFSHY